MRKDIIRKQFIVKVVFTLTNEHEVLPPKTCTIERLVTMKEDVEKVLNGQKTATRRNGRYADIGEIMTLENVDFVVERVYRQTLGELTDEHANQEGYANVEEYKQSILAIHPGMPWLSHMKVWVHEFRQVQK
ncbi:ASCH domain-containing protein [Bacillus kandeliae]